MEKSLVTSHLALGIGRKQLAGVRHWALGIGHCHRVIARRAKPDEAICFLSLLCLVIFSPTFVFAAASVSVTGNTWAIGTKTASVGTTSSSYTVTNDNSGGTEDIEISVGNSVNWTPSATASAGINQFVLQLTDGAGAVITGAYTRLVSGLVNNGTSLFTLYFTTPTAGSVEGSQTITVTLTATNWVFVCGNGLTVTHTAGTVAPVDKTVTYGTVLSSLSGLSKCWITQNLGADNQATSAIDATEPSAGWYWQFNRIQGFKHDGTTRTPSTAWDTTDDGTYTGWDPAKDPCILLLGTGWRLPTSTEWTNADANGPWANYNDTFASVLKLHAAGYLLNTTGALDARGLDGYYWSSTENSVTQGWELYFTSSASAVSGLGGKAYGDSVRCIKD